MDAMSAQSGIFLQLKQKEYADSMEKAYHALTRNEMCTTR